MHHPLRILTASLIMIASAGLVPGCAQSAPLGEAVDREGFYLAAAQTAWRFIEQNTNPSTGLVRATPNYGNATTWDIASGIAAVYSAWQLDIIEEAEYRDRIDRMFATLERLPLYDGVAYHKVYSVADGSMVNSEGTPSRTGYAWSATDLGRLLVWLRIIEQNDPVLAQAAARLAGRMSYDRIVKDGYLYGEDRHRSRPAFQEGRIGYEQYAATGFELWGHTAANALDVSINAQPIDVWGQRILRDGRGLDRLVSEPFVMMGLEVGLEGEMQALAEAVLALQRTRWERTDTVTIASEDAVDVPPHYFYYYCVYCNGRPFIIDVHAPGEFLDGPRWVSTKNAFGWNAIMPDDYTNLAVETVEPARTRDGWTSGVFEGTRRPTGTRDVNTAAIILESALYVKNGGPLLDVGE